MDPAQSCAIGTVQVLGVADRQGGRGSCGRSGGSSRRRSTTPSTTGIRVTPNVYTTLEEIDTFAEAMEKISAGPEQSTA